MLSAAGAFIWDAAIAAAVPGLDLVFRVPRANYVTVGSETQAHWERSFSSESAATFDLVQPSSASVYAVPLGLPALLGANGEANVFLRYLGQRTAAFQNEDGNLDDLTLPIDADLLSVDGELNDRARLAAIFFMKNLYESGGEPGAIDVIGGLLPRHSIAALPALIARDGFLINRAAYDALIDSLTAAILAEFAAAPVAVNANGNPVADGGNVTNASQTGAASLGRLNALLPLYIVAYLADLTGPTPKLAAALAPTDADAVRQIMTYLGTTNPDATLKLFRDAFSGLFDFPLTTHGVHLQNVAGTIELKTDNVVATSADLALYDLALDYVTTDADGNETQARIHFDWSVATPTATPNIWAFDFAHVQAVFPARSDDTLTLAVRSADSLIVWTKDYRAGNPLMGAVKIVVAMIGPGAVSAAERTPLTNKRLRGQILDLTRTATLKDAIVAIEVKAAREAAWRIVGSAAADAGGNFSMAYPVGVYAAAQAIVSLMPATPMAIPVHADKGDGHTVADDFLFLLLTLPPVSATAPANSGDPTNPGCECADPRASRLPDQSDLIRSGEYMQDLGNGCMNLSTPNRTLREYNYSAIVRTSDPDVANYTLVRDGDAFTLSGGAKLIKRRAIGLANPVRWQDAPDAGAALNFYQTVSVATGHILHYKSQFRADGYSLGDLLYSLPLAPGQKKQIAMFDASHRLTGSETQQISVGEQLAANLVNDRSVADQLGGSIGEGLKGNSNAHTEGMSMGVGGAASMGSMGASLGIAGGFSNSNSAAQQDSARVISQFFAEKLKNGISQNAESFRQQNATAVTTVAEGQGYSATTEVVANHNHCHSLTMMYFEVLRHFAIYQELANVEECVFVPLLMTNFTTANIFKFRDVLATNLLPMAANTYLPAVKGAHPLARAFDAIVRRQTAYDGLDFPTGRYCDETMLFIDGTLQVTIDLPRPKTQYDRIMSLPIVNKTVTHQEFDPVQQAKNIAVAPFTFGLSLAGGPAMKTVTETIQVREQIFDAFMTMQPNFATVPPAQSIRVHNFGDVTIPVAPWLIAMTPGSPGAFTIPADRFFDGNEADRRQWTAYAQLMGYTDVFAFLTTYFKGRLISEWDTIFYRDIAPALFERIVDNLIFSSTPPQKAPTPGGPMTAKVDPNTGLLLPNAQPYKGLSADFSTTSRYTGGTVRMTINVRGTSSIARQDVPPVMYLQGGGVLANLGDSITFRLEDMTLHYTTAHFTNVMFSGHLGDDLQDGTLVYMPLTSEDKRSPMHEDGVLERTLIDHLNSTLEHYNKALWLNLDADRRYLLLDGFNIQVYNDFGVPLGLKSLASVVKNELVAVAGNAMVIPVAAGVKVSRSYVAETTETAAPAKVTLLDHYKSAEPLAPYRLSVPTRGIYAEAMMGQCNSCEKVEDDTSQDWTKFGTDTPTAINALTPPTVVTTDWKATFKDLAAATVAFQKAPDAPAVGAGTAGLTGALTGPSGFKDITGLDKNQTNAIDTYKANNATVEKMATAAAGLASQEHNTANADKIKKTLDDAKASGALTGDEHKAATKAHVDQIIDGGAAAKLKAEAEAKAAKAATGAKSLTDAAVDAFGKNHHVVASKAKKGGGSDTLEVKPTTHVTPAKPGVPAVTPPPAVDPTADDTPMGPAKPTWKRQIFFKAVNCYGDPFAASFDVFVIDGATGKVSVFGTVDGGSGILPGVFTTEATSIQVRVSAQAQPNADTPIITPIDFQSDAVNFPATQTAINVILQQRPQKVQIATKESTLTGKKVSDELSSSVTSTIGAKQGGETSYGVTAAGSTAGGKLNYEVNTSVAATIAGKHATEISSTTGKDDGKTFEIIVPTNYYDLFIK